MAIPVKETEAMGRKENARRRDTWHRFKRFAPAQALPHQGRQEAERRVKQGLRSSASDE